MATSQDAVRRLTIQTSAPGADQAAASLHKVEDALAGVTVESLKTEKATLNLDQKFGSIEKRYVATVRAQQEYDKTQRMVNAAVAQNPALQERANAVMAAAAERLRAVSGHLNDNTKSMGLARHEMINLGRQAQDVGTMLAMGASPMQVVTSQAAQVIDIFASSQGTLKGFFGQITSGLASVLTVGRVVFAGIATAVGIAGAALMSYLDSQQKVQMSLLGSGRASGQSVSSINAVAQSSASTTGLSVSEARAFAAELASIGKIGKDNLEPLVKIGHDISIVFGTDAAGAAQLLGKAFSDPARGAEQLNERLGFLDAAMQRNIQNLQAQGRLQEAQRVLQAGVVSGLEGVSDAVSTSTKFWTALGNAASNAWDKIGSAASRATGIGLKLGLDEQLQQAQARLQELEAIAGRRSSSANQGLGTTNLIEQQRAKIDELTAAMQRYSQASVDAQQRQQSFAQAAAVRNQLPEIDQLQALRNEQEKLVKTMVDVQTTGGPASEVLKRMGMSYDELAKALGIANQNLTQFKSSFQSSFDQAKIAGDALTAFSPGARGDIARRQSIESTLGSKLTDSERQTLAQQAYDNAVKSVTVSLSEQSRARMLAANQNVASIQTEIDMVGKTIGQQAEMRANLQARQALEQQASQNRTAFDEAEFERLKKINAEIGKRQQMLAVKQLGSDIAFDRSQIGLNDNEAAANARLRYTFGDDAASAQAQFYKQQMMINSTLREFNDLGKDASKGFATDFAGALRNGASAADAFGSAMSNALNKISDKLMNMAVDNLWSNAFGGKGGSLAGLFGIGGSSELPNWGTSSFVGPTFADGGFTGPGSKYQPAGTVHAGEYVFSQSSVRRIGLGNLDRLHRGYAEGGYVQPVATNGNSMSPVVLQDNRTINIGSGASRETVEQLKAELERDRAVRKEQVIGIVSQARKERRL